MKVADDVWTKDSQALSDHNEKLQEFGRAIDHVVEEAADVVMTLSNLMAGMGQWDMECAMRLCELKNAQRGNYPEVAG